MHYRKLGAIPGSAAAGRRHNARISGTDQARLASPGERSPSTGLNSHHQSLLKSRRVAAAKPGGAQCPKLRISPITPN